MNRRVIEIGPAQPPGDRQRIGLVDAEAEREGEEDAREKEGQDRRQGQGAVARRASRARFVNKSRCAGRLQQIDVPNRPNG